MARTLTAPPTDRSYWKRLLARVHPDQGGSDDLFVWARSLQEHVSGNGVEPLPREVRRDPPSHHTAGERVDYTEAFDRAGSFDGLTRVAVMYADELEEPHASLLRMLRNCYGVGPDDIGPYRQQNQGATYRTLAAIAHHVRMSKPERIRWYSVCRAIPLSQRHASWLIKKLKGGGA